jgi:phage FluMu protein Com
MLNIKTSSVRCRHCDKSFRTEALTPGAKITCPKCGRALTLASANSQAPTGVLKPNLSDDDVLGFLGVMPTTKGG